MTQPINTEPTDTVVLLRELAADKALTIGQAWNALEHAANEIEALRTLENPIRSAAEPVADSALLPRELTAENGAKAALMGEFSETLEVVCPDCGGDDVDFTCPLCADSGLIVERIPVSWDLLKVIHRRVVQLFGAAPPPRPDPPEVDEAMVEIALAEMFRLDGNLRHAIFIATGFKARCDAAEIAWQNVYDAEIHPDGMRSDNRESAMRDALTAALKPAAGSV